MFETVQAILVYVLYKVKDSDNKALEWTVYVVQYILSCLKECFDSANKSALVLTQITGKPFMAAGLRAAQIQLKYITTSVFMVLISKFVTAIGVWCVTAWTVFVSFLLLKTFSGGNNWLFASELESWWTILLACAVLGYTVGHSFMDLYQSAIDCIYLCFLIDMDHNNGVPEHASPSFRKMYDDQAKQSEEICTDTKARANVPTLLIHRTNMTARSKTNPYLDKSEEEMAGLIRSGTLFEGVDPSVYEDGTNARAAGSGNKAGIKAGAKNMG